MKIVKKRLSELHEPEKNLRRHTEKQITEYIRSLKMFRQIKPIVIDENGEIIAGNGLFQALKRMGEDSCDCYMIPGLTPNQKKKLMLADNRVYELGITDADVFDEIIKDLAGDIDVPGWDADLLETITASVAEANQIIEQYGRYTPEEVQAVSARTRDNYSNYAAPSNAPAEPDTPSNMQNTPSGVPDHLSDTPSQNNSDSGQPDDPPRETASGRVIICPNCGERICL